MISPIININNVVVMNDKTKTFEHNTEGSVKLSLLYFITVLYGIPWQHPSASAFHARHFEAFS